MTEDEYESLRGKLSGGAADLGPELFKIIAASLVPVPPVIGLLGLALDQRPGTQLKRVARFVELLANNLERLQLQHERLERELSESTVKVEVVAEGVEAARTASVEAQLERLASVVAQGLRAQPSEATHALRRVRVLSGVDDDEFMVLVNLERTRRLDVPYPDEFAWVDASPDILVGAMPQREPLPTELQKWQISSLLTALGRLAGAGLVDADGAVKEGKRIYRSFSANPAGDDLVREALALTPQQG